MPLAIQSAAYEEQGAFTIWDTLGVEEIERSEEGHTTHVVIRAEDERTFIVDSIKPRLIERLKFLFGKPIPFALRETWKGFEVANQDEYEKLSQEEKSLQRGWVLQGPANPDVATGSNPTPKQQGEKALELLQSPRTHNPDLIKAIANLPAADEVLIKLPRGVKLNREEKSVVKKFVRDLLSGRPVTTKIQSPITLTKA